MFWSLWANLSVITSRDDRIVIAATLGDAIAIRRAGAGLILATAGHVRRTDEKDVRPPTAGAPSAFNPPAELIEVRDLLASRDCRPNVPGNARSRSHERPRLFGQLPLSVGLSWSRQTLGLYRE